jgi:peptidyl-prolyl cis-trans isomerase SurA
MNKAIGAAILVLALAWGSPAKIVDRIVAQINDDIVTLSDLNREMVEIKRDLATKFSGEQLDEEIKKAEKDVLEDLIRQKLLYQKGNELGFGANVDLQVTAFLERIRVENKLKDMQELEKAASQQGLTLPGLRDKIRRQIISQGVVQEFVGSRITLLSQDIEKFYKEHKADYTVPEEVTLSEIIIPVEGSASEAEARANEIRAKIVGGEAFASMASQYSKGLTANKGGAIGTYQTAKLNPEVAGAVAKVKDGECSAVMKGKEGYIIYRLDSRKPENVKPLGEIREEVKNRIWQEKFAPEYDRFIAQLKEEAYIQIYTENK